LGKGDISVFRVKGVILVSVYFQALFEAEIDTDNDHTLYSED
jgi:hypothetical protein